MSVSQDFINLDISLDRPGRSGNGAAAMRAFYSKAPEQDWAIQRKVWTVVGGAVISWGAIFGCAALIFRH